MRPQTAVAGAGDAPLILSYALFLGLFAAVSRVTIAGRRLTVPQLRHAWLVVLAFVPQLIAFFLPGTRNSISLEGAALALVSSQTLLLAFAWLNRNLPGFLLLGGGLTLNLLVILANGGLMPISPETVQALAPQASQDAWQVGARLGATKDLVLPPEAIRLDWLSDRFVLPTWFPKRAAFSIGDVLIGAGALWVTWAMGGVDSLSLQQQEVT